MKTAHTPTPWDYDGEIIFAHDNKPLPSFDRSRWPVAQIFDCGNEMANAAFIVKAVNCHDELVAMLECCYEALQSGGSDTPISLRIKAALAKAKGEV